MDEPQPDQPLAAGRTEQVELPSLNLLLDLVQSERDKQRAHFDSLDGKAGIILGFTGLIITLAPELPIGYVILVVLAALATAGLALAAFFPRKYPILEVGTMREYLTAQESDAKSTLHDTLAGMVVEGGKTLQRKGEWLTAAFIALGVTAAILGIGVVHDSLRGDDGGGPASSQSTPAGSASPTP
jgi:hypothetical protein